LGNAANSKKPSEVIPYSAPTDWYDGYLEKLGIDYIHGFGQLVNKNTVSVNGEEYTAGFLPQ
jgi:hypothetical protein